MTNDKKNGKASGETADFDTAISLTGYGRFHYENIALCSLSILIVGFQNGLPPYVLPAAQCELNLTSFHLGLLNVCFLIGGTLSCFLWGFLADTRGRRKLLIITHFSNSIITILCSILPHVGALTLCRFLNGFLIGAPGSIVFSYIAEFQPPKYRSRCICFCGFLFTLSWLLLPAMAYYILPLDIHFNFHNFVYMSPWRLFMIIVAVPESFLAIWFIRMAESPKFYLANGNTTMALIVLRNMFAANTGKNAVLYPVKYLISDTRDEPNRMKKISSKGRTMRMLQKMGRVTGSMFRPPLLRATVLTCIIMFTNMFGMFGLGLWLPELFSKFEQYQTLYPNKTVSVQELVSLTQAETTTTCEPSYKPSVIYNTIGVATTAIVYNIIASWMSSFVHAKKITMISMILGGICAGSIYWMKSAFQNLIVACIFQATMVTCNMTIAGIGVELFPTKVNSIAVCFIMASGRIGAALSNALFGWLIDKRCEIPISIVSVLVIVGGVLCAVVPKKETTLQTLKPEISVSVISNSWQP